MHTKTGYVHCQLVDAKVAACLTVKLYGVSVGEWLRSFCIL